MNDLTHEERSLADYLVNKHKKDINAISPSCVSPLQALRKALRPTVANEYPATTKEQWFAVTRWIFDKHIANPAKNT